MAAPGIDLAGMGTVAETFWLLLVAHAVSDFALQSQFMAEAKSPAAPALGGERVWPWVLGAHALVNSAGVYLVTGSPVLAAVEAVVHGAVDYGKARGAFGFHADQALHVASKVGLALLAAWPA